jgi:succinate dehydrogenase/fumarate reductase flavoprotein subunit
VTEPGPAGWGDEWDSVTDVVVVGSGVAGLAAAVAAASRGASVVVLERGAFTGGTTAKSGGVLWIPNNPLMRERGLVDDRTDALRYLARTAYPTLYNADHETLGLPADKHELLETFFDTGSAAIEELIAVDALSLESVDYPDYYADLPEDTAPNGRALQPVFPPGWRRGIGPTGGQLLIDRLQAAAERLGATVLLEHRAAHLVRNDHLEVIGLEVQVGRRTELFGARRGVIFCSGGFLHNKRLVLEFLRGPVLGGAAAEGSTGDFVDIGIEAGTQLGNMTHAWWDQVVAELAVRVPETVRDVYEPFGDSMVIVDRRGRRVVNEKIPYNERAQVHFAWDPVRREYPNLLLFMVWDEAVAANPDPTRFRFPVPPPGEHYDFVISAPTFEALAGEIAQRLEKLAPWTGGFQLDPGFAAGLAATVERFDAMAEAGRDVDFHRGETPIEEAWAGPPRLGAATATMHRFATEGPYHCVIVGAGALDTKGGPVIDSAARVLTPSGEPIAGLYGAGNCIASPAGQAYWGAGGTIGLALTYGFIAGREAAAAPAHSPTSG